MTDGQGTGASVQPGAGAADGNSDAPVDVSVDVPRRESDGTVSASGGAVDVGDFDGARDHPDVAKLFSGEWMQYRSSRVLPEFTWEAQSACATINRIFYDDRDRALRLFHELVPQAGEGVDFRPPIRLDYGLGLVIGDRTFINMDLLVVGGGSIIIGSDCLIGPRCSIYTPNHAIEARPRLEGWQRNRGVSIGVNVWLGGNVVICPGVAIGNNSVIGAGSVVTSDIPPDCVAAGNPCRVVHTVPADWSEGERSAALGG